MKVFIAQVTEIHESVTAVADTALGAARLALAEAQAYLSERGATDHHGKKWTQKTIVEWFGVIVYEAEIGSVWREGHAGTHYNDLAEII